MSRHRSEALTVIGSECTERRLAQPHRPFQHCIEDRSEIPRRGIDDAKHFGGRGLLLQRFARLDQEPRILHRDNRLRREVLHERNLIFGKRSNFLTKQRYEAQKRLLFGERDLEHRSRSSKIDQRPTIGFTATVSVLFLHI